MKKSFVAALLAAALVGTMAQPFVASADLSERRERQMREARDLPSKALEALNAQDADRAIALYTRAIDSGAFRNEPETLGQLYLERANAHLMKNDCNAAIADFTKAAEYIRKGEIFFRRASCYMDMNQEDRALADFGLAIEADPEAPAYRKSRCILLFNRMNYAAALPDCEKALAAAPNDKNLMLATSQAAEQTGNRARAAELYRRLLAAEPGNAVAAEGLKRVGM
jgi:tetratricopeptide (TPR) repeat protein